MLAFLPAIVGIRESDFARPIIPDLDPEAVGRRPPERPFLVRNEDERRTIALIVSVPCMAMIDMKR